MSSKKKPARATKSEETSLAKRLEYAGREARALRYVGEEGPLWINGFNTEGPD